MRQQGRKKSSKRKSEGGGELFEGFKNLQGNGGKLDLKQELETQKNAQAHEKEDYENILKVKGGN